MGKVTMNLKMVTPEIAKEYLTKNTNNRPVSLKTVEYYAEQMRKGLWTVTPESISFDKFGRLLNGQHRLNAIIVSGVAQQLWIGEGYDPDILMKLDKGKGRSTSDDLYIKGVPNYRVIATGLSVYMRMVRINSSMVDTKSTNDKYSYSSEEVFNEYKSDSLYDTFATDASKFYSMNKFRLYSKTEYFAWLSFLVKVKKHSYEKVTDFFKELNTHSKTEIINELKSKLIEDRNKKSVNKFTTQYKQKMLIKCWNEYIKGNNPKKINVKSDNKIEFI